MYIVIKIYIMSYLKKMVQTFLYLSRFLTTFFTKMLTFVAKTLRQKRQSNAMQDLPLLCMYMLLSICIIYVSSMSKGWLHLR